MKRERDPTPEEFERLLVWLDSDRNEAGQKYETIHYRLIRIFISRGCIEAESLADETMNRVAVRIEKVTNTYQGEPGRCFHGFAEKVYLEYQRDRWNQSHLDPPVPPEPPDDDEPELKDECLTRCMEKLSAAERNLFRRYFQEEKRQKIESRKKLAAELRLTANALRIKAHRLRRTLRQCMDACLEGFRHH